MKLKFILSSGIFAVFVAVLIGAQTASATESATEVKASATAEPPAKKSKPHSHATEKTGLPAQAAEPKADATVIAADKKKRHFHPRDGK